MREKVQYVYVPVGLPGSGKTTYFETTKENVSPDMIYVDGDSFMMPSLTGGKSKGTVTRLEHLIEHIRTLDAKFIYLDGLFLTQSVQEKLDNAFRTSFIYFEPHKENCLYNDAQRGRELSARGTILNRTAHKPKNTHVSVHTRKWDYIETLLLEYGLSDTFQGTRWNTGGDYRSYDMEDEESWKIEPETAQPLSNFREYVTTLEKFYGDEWKDYFDVYKHLINVVHEEEPDYYGGCAEIAYHHFDVREFIEAYLTKEYGITCYDTKYIEKFNPELLV